MKCGNIREQLMEAVLSGPELATPAVQEHLASCAACAEEIASLRRTMELLDEWQAPEPSPYFSARLRARLRDEHAHERGTGALAEIEIQIPTADPLKRVNLIQERLNLRNALGTTEDTVDMAALEADFVRAAGGYSARKGLTYAAWRELGVEPALLAKAGITRGS